jgi:hypothetical protein
MADGSFTGLVSRNRDANAASNIIWVNLSDETNSLVIDASGYLTTNINGTVTVDCNGTDVTVDNGAGAAAVNIQDGGNSITVDATNLDIRDLNKDDDEVLIWANTAKDGTGTDYVPLVDADGKLIISNPGGTEYTEDDVAVTATGIAPLAERDDALGGITPVEGDWSKLYVNANGALWVKHDGTMTVDASDLDIRDLVHTQDSVALGDGTGVLVDVLDSTIDALYTAITDGTETLNITAAGEAEVDIAAQSLTALKISKDANANTETNPIYVYQVNTVVSGSEVHDYDLASAIASDASSNHDYAVANTTFFLKSVIVSGSGNVKFEIIDDPAGAATTVAVGFLTGRQGDTKQVFFDPPVECTTTLRVTKTNRQGSATDLYSTIIGNDV